MFGWTQTCDMGTKSLAVSNVRFWYRLGLITIIPEAVISNV